jgi:hypothetical protein
MPVVGLVTRVFCVPLFFAGLLAVAVALIETGAPTWVLPILLVVALTVSALAERLAPYEPVWNQSHGDIGVAGQADYPRSYFDQLIEPFRRPTSLTPPDRGLRTTPED